ncbi:hypothetical protein [Cyclobacterium jeungdonense]|uniref:Uncharacterized protein n=1 Tax=Cyclobacterium jeungdonense TaxID=708087 RepID=A0ABT8CDH1_9BACT|nr:hypothetical protein [Cyclobacterium jeungdonense]MDN3690247.1 hypothetical protein [Cyclobacterium jeungdonense]
MELLTYSRSAYLLNASLESLHVESREWINEMDFLKDEVAFFHHLIKKNETIKSFPAQEFKALENELILIGNKVGKMREKVSSHEQQLAALFKTTQVEEEEAFRKTHRKLLLEMYDLHYLVRKFKKNVYSFVKNYE